MSQFSKISMFVVIVISMGLVTSADAQWPQTTSHNPYKLEVGVIGFDRPGSDLNLPVVTNTTTGATLLDSNDLTDLGVAPAAEVRFTFNSNICQEWEVRAILANWEEEIDAIAGPNIASPLFFGGVVPNEFDYAHDSDMFSVELMARQSVRPGMVAMFGPRIVSTKDTVLVTSQVVREEEASNFLMGFQGGLEFNRPISNGIYANGFIRAGGYYNPTESTLNVSGFAVEKQQRSTGSFLGEVGGRLYYDLLPNCASLYLGYDATWIDGIAQASSNLFNPVLPARIETANTDFFHGVTFGLKMNY